MVKSVAGMVGAALTVDKFVDWMKSAIDAGDHMKEFSLKTGVAIEEVAGLQLAFKQGGVDGDELTKSLGKLSKQMVEGNDSFDKLGVKTRNADGSMRSVKDVLYDVADATAGMADGAQKAALMQELFGKSGTALIPTLNEGSEGLRKMAEMADKLGLSMSSETAEAADSFNDTVELLGLGLEGVARKTMAQLLPTLTNLAGVFLETATSGSTLQTVADGIAVVLKGLVSIGVVVSTSLMEVGKNLGAVAAAVVAALSGDFSGAMTIVKTRVSDFKDGVVGAGETIGKVWSGTGDAVVAATAKVVTAGKNGTVMTKEQEAAAKKLGEEYAKLMEKITQRTVEVKAETVAGRALTEAEKNAIEITKKYTGAKRDNLLVANASLKAAEDEKRAKDDLVKTMAAVAAHSTKVQDALEKQTESMRAQYVSDLKGNEALQQQISLMGLSGEELLKAKQAIAAREAAVLRSQASDLEWQAAMEGGNRELEEQARLLRERAKLGEDRALLEAQKSYKDEWVKTNDQIGQSLTDALMQGGKSAWEYIKGLVRTTVLRPIVEMVAKPIAGGIMDLFGLANGSSGASGGLGSLVSMFSSLSGAASSAWSYITGASAAGSAASGAMIGGGLEGGAAAGGLGGLSSIGMSIPIIGAIIAGMLSADKAYSMGYSADNLSYVGHAADQRFNTNLLTKLGVSDRVANILTGGALSDRLVHLGAGTVHTGASSSFSEAGGLTTGAGLYGVGSKAGAYSAVTENLTSTVSQSVVGILDSAANVFGKKAGYSVAAAFADDVSSDPAWGALSIDLAGKLLGGFGASGHGKWPGKEFANKEEGIKQFIAESALETRKVIDSMQLPQWARDVYSALGGAPTLEQLAQTTVQVASIQKQLTTLGTDLAPLGGVFGSISGLSSQATYQLVQFAGGIDALMGKAKNYVDLYYTDAEKAGIQASQVKAALVQAGITTDLASKEDFRALMDSLAGKLDTETGAKQFTALLDIATGFASVADYLKEQGKTLDDLAASAPQSVLIDSLTADSQAQTDIASQQLGQLELLTQQTESTTAEVTNLRGDVIELQSAMLAVAENTNRMAKLFEGWNGTDGLNVVAVPA